MVRPTYILLNPIEFNHSLFMIILDKANVIVAVNLNEVVKLLMTYLRKYLFQVKLKKKILQYLLQYQ